MSIKPKYNVIYVFYCYGGLVCNWIETFITNLLNGNIKDFYPAIVITDEMDDGYNIYFIKIDFLNWNSSV